VLHIAKRLDVVYYRRTLDRDRERPESTAA
jgi:hypothetical protein